MHLQVDTEVGRPRVNYREAITQRVEFDYLHKKQSGESRSWRGWPRGIAGLSPLLLVSCGLTRDQHLWGLERMVVWMMALGGFQGGGDMEMARVSPTG